MSRVPTIIDEGHATDLASPDRDRNPLTRVSCWARRARSRQLCAEAPAYKFLGSRVLSSFVFLDTTGARVERHVPAVPSIYSSARPELD